jgi:hypothetical protein
MGNKLNGWHTDKEGTRRHYQNGLLHREDGPAFIYSTGTQAWFLNGEIHREDGPAIIFPSGYQGWRLKGERVRMEDVLDTPEKREAYFLEEALRRL